MCNKPSDIIFQVDKLTVVVHSPSKMTTEEEDKRQLAKFLYRLIEIDSRTV